MPTINSASLVFRVNFNVYSNTLTLSDLYNYSGNYADIFSLVDSSGNIFYQNPGWASNDFSSPDLSQSIATKVLSGSNFPIDSLTDFIKQGNYTLFMKNSIDGGTTYTQTGKVLTMDYARPYPNISLVADTNASVLAIADNTNYNVLHNGNSLIPTLTFNQNLVAPINPVTGLPVVANVTSAQKTFTVGPDIYTRVYVDTTDTTAVYSLETWNSQVWAIITDTILGSKDIDVKDDTCMCAYYQCIASLQAQLDAVDGNDPVEYRKLRHAKDRLNDYMGMYLWAVKCGKESAYWCKKIKEILLVTVPCDCAQDDDAPHIIVPISGGGGGSITPSTFKYTFGTGSAGFPVSPSAGDIHEFTDTSGAYNEADIYQYNGTAWAFELNTKGPKGDAGTDASGVSAVTIYSDLSPNGNPPGTTNTVLKTYTFPALTMVNNGDMIKILGMFTYAQTDDAKLSQITWNGDVVSQLYSDALVDPSSVNVRLEAEVNRVNLINQICNGIAIRGGGTVALPQVLSTADLSNSVVITANGQSPDVATANEVICTQLSVMLFSMIHGAIIGSSNFAQGIAYTVGNTPLAIAFASTFASTSYSLSINCYDSLGNPQTFTVDKNLKLTTGFTIETLVDAIVEWTAILK